MFAGEVDLKNWYKPNIDKKTLKELSKRSDLKGTIDITLFVVALILSGYLCIISWGTLWSIPALLLYGNIFYCKIISIQHETNHETFFKTRWLNKLFYNIACIMSGFEQFRWKWSHFHHHSYTISTHQEDYDYENNTPRPTEPIRFLINFLPFGPLINIQKIRHFSQIEILKHAFGFIAPAAEMTVPKSEMSKVKIMSSFFELLFF